jgi:hypothetical protein
VIPVRSISILFISQILSLNILFHCEFAAG